MTVGDAHPGRRRDGLGGGAHGDHGHAQEHGGHEHLSHVPDAARASVFAARADLAFDPPARPDEAEDLVLRFFGALFPALVAEGCTLVGHIKGTLATHGRGGLAFHATSLTAKPALSGGLTGAAADVLLTVNVIVFGVDEEALGALVREAWAGATPGATSWLA